MWLLLLLLSLLGQLLILLALPLVLLLLLLDLLVISILLLGLRAILNCRDPSQLRLLQTLLLLEQLLLLLIDLLLLLHKLLLLPLQIPDLRSVTIIRPLDFISVFIVVVFLFLFFLKSVGLVIIFSSDHLVLLLVRDCFFLRFDGCLL